MRLGQFTCMCDGTYASNPLRKWAWIAHQPSPQAFAKLRANEWSIRNRFRIREARSRLPVSARKLRKTNGRKPQSANQIARALADRVFFFSATLPSQGFVGPLRVMLFFVQSQLPSALDCDPNPNSIFPPKTYLSRNDYPRRTAWKTSCLLSLPTTRFIAEEKVGNLDSRLS